MFEGLLGKLVGKKLKGGFNMDDTPKPWYKSWGMWGGVLTIIRAGYGAAQLAFSLPPVPPGVDAFLIGVLGASSTYGRYTASQKIG